MTNLPAETSRVTKTLVISIGLPRWNVLPTVPLENNVKIKDFQGCNSPTHQKKGLLEVELEEAATLAAKFHVECRSDAQVVCPLVYLAQRHTQTRGKPSWTLKTKSRFRHCLCIIVYSCICTCIMDS